ncbi:MAG: hypothetical protein GY773_31275 [Actinomycetia bacterium]|nr:hypothetical protein [Actinomycetes bacterium]
MGLSRPWKIAAGHGSVWTAYVGNDGTCCREGADTLHRINPDTNEIIASIEIESGAWGVEVDEESVWVSSSGPWAVSNQLEATFAQVDPVTNEVVAVYQAPYGATEFAVSHGFTWVVDGDNGSLVRLLME